LCLHLPTGGVVEATQSATKGSVCLGASHLIGLGAISSAEEAPPTPASSPVLFFVTSFSLLDTSTSIAISEVNSLKAKKEGIHQLQL
jgi:hypothetical protein